jgi:hypothetical protein
LCGNDGPRGFAVGARARFVAIRPELCSNRHDRPSPEGER